MKTNRPRVDALSAPQARRRLALKATALLGWGGLAAALPGCGGGSAEPLAAPAQAPGQRRHAMGGVDGGGTGKPGSFFSVALRGVAPLTGGGVVFGTPACQFLDADGAAFDAATLAPGMTVRIDASAVVDVTGQPSADALVLRRAEQLIGAVQSVNGATATLVVWQQTVVVQTDTVFDTTLAADWSLLPPGTRVRVWGQLDMVRRRIVATRIDRPDADDQDAVRGVLTQIDRASGTVGIGGLRVRLAAGDPVPLPDDLAVGDVVRLTLGPDEALLGVRDDALALPDRDTTELEGRVTAVGDATQFHLDGVPVDASAASWTVPGPLTPGQRVAVEGHSSGGVLIARSVDVQRDEDDAVIELQGSIQTVDAAARQFVVRRKVVRWSDDTRFEGAPPAWLQPRRKVEVKGRRSADGALIEAFMVNVED